MQKRFLAIMLCLVMVSAFAATGAVSAKNAGQSNVRQYSLKWVNDAGQVVQYGTLTVTVLPDGSGTFILNTNPQKIGGDYHQVWRQYLPGTTSILWGEYPSGTFTPLAYNTALVNQGGTQHGTGTLSADAVNWLVQYGNNPDAIIST